MHRSVHASVGILLALTACDPDPPPPPPPPDPVPLAQNQLQIMTWNVLFFEITAVVNGAALPGFAQEFTYRTAESSFNGLTYEDRAEEVAAGIRRANPDVVVLNEVFSDAARNILIDELEADYPHYVSRLAGNPPVEDAELASIDLFTDVIPPPFDSYIIEPLDSGLMLFSKVPFTPLPNTYDDATFGIEGWSNGPISSSYVAFLRYEDCTGLDCFSSKGAGLVALDTVGGPTYVAFSHMQAEDAADERWSQYNEVEDFLYEVIPNNDLASYPVYFAGDLNTPGGSAEWEGRFDPAVASTNFFACGNDRPCFVEDPRLLTDAWGFETSPDDAGPTSRGNNRLDYILHSHADNQLCMQHIRKPYEVRGGAGEGWFSDHRPVLADMNLPAQWCSPNLADPFEERRPRVLQFGPLDCVLCDQDINITAADGATLDHAGSFQWFVIDQEGSYSLRTISNHPTPGVEVDFDVYHHENLSQPLEPFRPIPDSHFGFTFPMYDPPYYIRTYVTTNGEPDRTYGNVEYQFIAHQHLCRSAVDACAIDPLDQVTHPWPDQTLPLVDVPEIWYRFKTASVAGGILADPALAEAREPDVSFLIDSSEAPDTCLGTPQVVDFTDPLAPGVPQWMPDWASDSVDVDETLSMAAGPVGVDLHMDDRKLSADVRGELQLRVTDMTVRRFRGGSRGRGQDRLYVRVVPAAGGYKATITTSDGTVFERNVETSGEDNARQLASELAVVLAGVRDGTLEPDREGATIPTSARERAPPRAQADAETRESRALALLKNLEVGPFFSAGGLFGFLPARDIAASGAGFGEVGGTVRFDNGAAIVFAFRPGGRHQAPLGLVRSRFATGAGGVLRFGKFELALSGLLTAEPWAVRDRGDERVRRRDPLLGIALRLGPGARIIADPRRDIALRVGPFLELATSATLTGGVNVPRIRRDDQVHFRLGGVEAVGGFEVQVWIPTKP